MIPYTLLIVPNYSIISSMGLLNTYMALILPYIAGAADFRCGAGKNLLFLLAAGDV